MHALAPRMDLKKPALGLLVLAVVAALMLEADDARRSAVRGNAPASASPADTATLHLATAAGTLSVSLAELRERIRAETVSVRSDPSYAGRAKRYVGFPLERVLEVAGLRPSGDEVLHFEAADGFRATLSEPVRSPGVRGVVAFRDVEGGADGWERIGTGEAQKSPAPFYLVWSADSAAVEDPALQRPWPYQLVRIEVIDPRVRYDRLFPAGVPRTDPVYRGYRAFVVSTRGGDQCISCHTLNLQGGTVGPELNVPRNITEYRDEATLRAFIRNARAFRARSPMPPFDLSEQELDDMLAYLRWMREHKVEAPDPR